PAARHRSARRPHHGERSRCQAGSSVYRFPVLERLHGCWWSLCSCPRPGHPIRRTLLCEHWSPEAAPIKPASSWPRRKQARHASSRDSLLTSDCVAALLSPREARIPEPDLQPLGTPIATPLKTLQGTL